MEALNLKVDSVHLEFDGRKILQDIYLNCSKGEVLGILGRNGCGKSSLLKIIFGTLACTHKYVSINDDYIVKGYHNNRIAYLPQHNYLPGTIRIDRLAKMLVDEVYWADFSSHPIYQQHQLKMAPQLSGGELRQLETLMIIYSKADFILLDEPFTHISPIQAEEFKHIIRNCAKTKGIVITDHQYYNVLDVSDRIILISNGSTKPIHQPADLIAYGYVNHIN
ncbi:ATP-binding cassette domain-containing protein [Mucilaginibacter gynuensis]|uniref:ATP-binding cassette domain-containing protein n=1 Tax=Mucilaginibacter gynuensis TaxID=1302236 RepID=A0ABP8FZ55_9SPHI